MNAVLIIAHAPLANALRQSALHVFPDCEATVGAIDVQPNLTPEETAATGRIMLQQLGAVAHVDGVLVLADIFGATPCNVAQKLVDNVHSRLVAGVNLPMLLRSLSYRHEPLDTLAARAVAGGTQGVMQVAPSAPQNQPRKHHDQDHDHHQQ